MKSHDAIPQVSGRGVLRYDPTLKDWLVQKPAQTAQVLGIAPVDALVGLCFEGPIALGQFNQEVNLQAVLSPEMREPSPAQGLEKSRGL